MPKQYTDEILNKAYDLIVNKKYSANKAAKELQIDCGTMRKRLKKKKGLTLLADGKKYVDSHFFDVIDSEKKAYWLGFLTADGYVNNNTEISLCLAEVDKAHIESFKEDLKSDHIISKKKTKLNEKEFISYRISFKDKHMNEVLKSYGLTNNKSYDAYIPNCIPNNLMKHYFRGLIDGDGSIMNRSGAKHLFDISFCSGSNKMIEQFVSIIEKNLDVKMKIRKSRGLVEARLFNQVEIKLLLKWLYGESTIHLPRKYDKIYAVLR